MNQSSLVKMSGQFWKLSMSGNDILLTSTILGIQTKLTLKDFTSAIIRGIIHPCGLI